MAASGRHRFKLIKQRRADTESMKWRIITGTCSGLNDSKGEWFYFFLNVTLMHQLITNGYNPHKDSKSFLPPNTRQQFSPTLRAI